MRIKHGGFILVLCVVLGSYFLQAFVPVNVSLIDCSQFAVETDLLRAPAREIPHLGQNLLVFSWVQYSHSRSPSGHW